MHFESHSSNQITWTNDATRTSTVLLVYIFLDLQYTILFKVYVYNCRNTDYLRALNSDPTLCPLSLQYFSLLLLADLLEIAKSCLNSNYLSAVLTMIGGIVSFHYKSILQIQDECSLFCITVKNLELVCHWYLVSFTL